MEEVFNKYSNSVLNSLDQSNINKIISFLTSKNCNFTLELLEDYLDLFTIDYEKFVRIFNKCDCKYHNKYLQLVEEDMNLLEELFYE